MGVQLIQWQCTVDKGTAAYMTKAVHNASQDLYASALVNIL